MSDWIEDLARGATAGFAATGPMTVFMEAMHRLLPRHEKYPLPPRQITEQAAREVGVHHDLNEPEQRGLTLAAHFGFGATMGAGYGLIEPHLPLPPLAKGIGYGLAVWAANYAGWMPAADVSGSAPQQSPRRNSLLIAAHVVFGSVLGLLADEMRRRGREPLPGRDDGYTAAGELTGKFDTPRNESFTSAEL